VRGFGVFMRVIILDTETTGLKNARPVEVAYIDVSRLLTHPMIIRGFDIIFEYRQLFNPMQPIEFGAMATHHITNSDVVDCELYTSLVLPESVEYMIGHNIDFDWQIIQSCGVQPEPKRICTLAMSRYLYPEIDSHKLTAMLYALDYDFARENATSAHSALDDVWMTLRLLELLLPLTKATNFEELYQFSEMARIPKIITFGKHNGQKIELLPIDYKQWLLKQTDIDPYLRKALTQA
jgi:exodeoxyribonuclease X